MLDKMEKVREHMARSPLRKVTSPLPGTVRFAELARADGAVTNLSSGLHKPLSLVVMGEVKAGKSTLINALAGAAVSPSDVLETTAAIMEIRHAEKNTATIYYHNGESREYDTQVLYDELETHSGDAGFFAQVKQIEVGLPLPNLKRLRLVDTPGLATITDANAEVALDYVQQADVVLWVLNGQHLGQADVVEAISGVAKLGKPIIGVVNRIDQVEGSQARLVQYVQRELAAYVTEVFPLSAQQAFAGVVNESAELAERSGFTAVLSFLTENLDQRADDAKLASLQSSLDAVLRLDTTLHTSYGEQLAHLLRLARENWDEMRRRGRNIANQMKQELTERVYRELFTTEFNWIQAQPKLTKEMLEEAFSLAVLEDWWQKTFTDMSRRLTEEWQASHAEYVQQLKGELTELAAREEVAISAALEYGSPNIWGETLSTAAKGGVTGSATGFGLAAYAAWLGPYASLGLASAALAWIPPVAVAGALSGAVFGIYNHLTQGEKRQRDLITALRGHIREEQQTFVNAFLIPKVFPAISKSCEEQADELHQRFLNEACSGWQLQGIAELTLAIEAYSSRAKLLLVEPEDTNVKMAAAGGRAS